MLQEGEKMPIIFRFQPWRPDSIASIICGVHAVTLLVIVMDSSAIFTLQSTEQMTPRCQTDFQVG